MRREGAGVRLLVATTDPRRELVVRIGPDRGAALRVRVTPTSTRGVTWMADSFASGSDEAFHGFGGRHWDTNQRGQKLYGWIEEENIGGPATLNATPLLPGFVEEGTGRSLADLGFGDPADLTRSLPGRPRALPVPRRAAAAPTTSSTSSSPRARYGFLLNRDELAAGGWPATRQRVAGPVGVGGARLHRRGRAAAPRDGHDQRDHRPPPAAARVGAGADRLARRTRTRGRRRPRPTGRRSRPTCAEIERRRPPLTGYAFEGWGLLNDDEYVRSVIQRLNAMGIEGILYVRAFVADDPLRTQSPGDFERGAARGPRGHEGRRDAVLLRSHRLARRRCSTSPSPPRGRGWRDRVRRTLDLGAGGFMQDFGEQMQSTGCASPTAAAAADAQPLPGALPPGDARRSSTPTSARTRAAAIWFFTRAGYSGRPGSAAYERRNFPGDETIDWSAAIGLRSLAPDMLNRAVGGAFGYTTDIGGYVDCSPARRRRSCSRAGAEWAALTPYFRVHNSPVNGTRMPWSFDETTYGRWLALARAAPARGAAAVPAVGGGRRTGVPPTRPLWLAFPGDARAAAQDQQWMLGDDVLVAPVVSEGADGRGVYFPRGCWTRPETGERFTGPRSARCRAPLGQLPYFFRCGRTPL